MERLDAENRLIFPSKPTGRLSRKSYLRELPGKPIDDNWHDIPMVQRESPYPTQKPVALYERIIKAACPPDGLVLDPFMGSGTTLIAADRNGRRWCGIDASQDAIDAAVDRLKAEAVMEQRDITIKDWTHEQTKPL